MRTLVPLFEQSTGHKTKISYGSTGKLFAQIKNGAPFDIFMSADTQRPLKIIEQGMAVAGSNVAIGKQLRVRVLARDVSIALDHQENTSILNLLPATIKQVVDNEHPAVKLVQVKVGETTLLSRVTTRSVDVLGLKMGDKIWLQIKSVAVLE